MPIGAQSVHRALLDLHYVAPQQCGVSAVEISDSRRKSCRTVSAPILGHPCPLMHPRTAATSSALESILNATLGEYRCGSPLARIGRAFMKPDTIFRLQLL